MSIGQSPLGDNTRRTHGPAAAVAPQPGARRGWCALGGEGDGDVRLPRTRELAFFQSLSAALNVFRESFQMFEQMTIFTRCTNTW